MATIRTERSKDNPYITVTKDTLEERNLSWGAKGVWCFLMTLPGDMDCKVEMLIKDHQGQPDEKKMHNFLNELIEQGYCSKVQKK